MSNNLDLLLINIGGTKEKVYQNLSKDYSAIEPPFWAALTAGFIQNRDYSVKILDSNAENLSLEESADIVEDYNPKLTNIIVYGQQPAASTQLMTSVGKLCKKIKNKNQNRKIILTGLHPSALPKKTLEEEDCDFVGQGEGFYTLLGLLQNKKIEEIPGLWYKQNENILNNPRAKNIQNLTSELGDVSWNLLPMDKYKAHNWQCLDDLSSRPRYASLSTSLGCPFKCDFCAIHTNFGERKIRYWSPEWVVNQLITLSEKYNVKNIKIIDEMFLLNPKHFMIIANGIIEKKLDLNIWAYARVDTTKEKYLKKLKKAGFNWLGFGFEAGSDIIRQEIHKGKFDKQDIIDVRKKVEDAGINIIGNYIFGLPEDDLGTMKKTLDLAIYLNCEFANFYSAMAYPGSQLYDNAKKQGVCLPEDNGGPGWEGYSQHSYECVPLPTNKINSADVLNFRDNAFNTYFTNHKYLSMIEKKFGLKAKEHIQKMTKINLKRRLLGD